MAAGAHQVGSMVGNGPAAPQLQALGMTDAQRREAFARAERHSRRVALLRRALPVVGVLSLSAYFIFAQWSLSVGNMSGRIAGLQLSSDKLTMLNPMLEGANERRGAYKVTAARAIQNIATPDIVDLEEVSGEMDQPDGTKVTLSATRGRFRTKHQVLVLNGQIKIDTSRGDSVRMRTARIDMRKQRITSQRPVFAEVMNGTVQSNRLEVLTEQRLMTFSGDVRVVIVPRENAGAQGDRADQGAAYEAADEQVTAQNAAALRGTTGETE